MLPVIVPPIRKGICRFIIDFKIVSTTIIYKQHTIIVVVEEFFSLFHCFF
jgi:hypothetical protein